MRVGVIGSFVWDVIYGRDPRHDPVEEWGGITYALSAFDAALPESWQALPLAKLASDLWPHARRFVSSLRPIAPDAMRIRVPDPTNRVRLDSARAEWRSEFWKGGV